MLYKNKEQKRKGLRSNESESLEDDFIYFILKATSTDQTLKGKGEFKMKTRNETSQDKSALSKQVKRNKLVKTFTK